MTSPESRMQEMPECRVKYFEAMRKMGRAHLAADKGMLAEMTWEIWQAAWSARTMPVEAIQRAIQALTNQLMDLSDEDWSAQEKKELRTHIAALTQLLEQGRD